MNNSERIHLVLTGLGPEGFNPDSGGIQLAEISFAKSLALLGYGIIAYVAALQDSLSIDESGVIVQSVDLGSQPSQGGICNSLVFSLKTAAKIVEATSGKPNDIVHFTSIGPAMIYFSNVINYQRKKQGGPKSVYTLHNYHYAIADKPYDIFEKYPEEWFLLHQGELGVVDQADQVWVTNSYFAEELSRRFGRQIIYMPNTIGKITKYERYKIKTNFHICLTMCRIAPEKNIPIIIEAFNLASQEDPLMRLLIAGSGEDINKIEQLLQSKPLTYYFRTENETVDQAINRLPNTKIVFLGEVQGLDKRRIWQISDVFVLPSLREVSPLVGLEAMKYGKPVVASNIYGWIDYHDRGAPIYISDPNNIESVATGIAHMINLATREKGPSISQKARTVYNNHYSPSVVVPRRLEQYEKMQY